MPRYVIILLIISLIIALTVPSFLIINPVSRITTVYQSTTLTQTETVLVPTTFSEYHAITQKQPTFLDDFIRINYTANQSLCTSQRSILIVGASFAVSDVLQQISSNFANSYCINIEDIFDTNSSATMLGVVYGVLDFGVTSNYSDYQQILQFVQQRQLPASPVAFQIGNTSSGALFWIVANSPVDENITSFVKFANSSVLSNNGN
jgi:hypothetical protein